MRNEMIAFLCASFSALESFSFASRLCFHCHPTHELRLLSLHCTPPLRRNPLPTQSRSCEESPRPSPTASLARFESIRTVRTLPCWSFCQRGSARNRGDSAARTSIPDARESGRPIIAEWLVLRVFFSIVLCIRVQALFYKEKDSKYST